VNGSYNDGGTTYKFNMEGCPAGDAGPVLNTGGGSDAQGFDYAILPPIYILKYF